MNLCASPLKAYERGNLAGFSDYPKVEGIGVGWVPVEQCSSRPLGIIDPDDCTVTVFEAENQRLRGVRLFRGAGDVDGDGADNQAGQDDEKQLSSSHYARLHVV